MLQQSPQEPIVSIFRYPGGKARRSVCDWIISNAPPAFREYREPFVGGGGIFFSMRRDVKRWVNDVHSGLVSVYLALRDRPTDFIAKCRAVEPERPDDELAPAGPRGGVRWNARLKRVFDSVAFDETADPAFRYFFCNRTVFGGRVNYALKSRLYFSNPSGWNIVATNALEEAAEALAGVRITCGDYRRLFQEPGEGVFVYADPPYMTNERLSRSSQLYEHGFSMSDFLEFAIAVRDSPHKIAISFDNEEIARVLFPAPRFRILESAWKYSGTTDKVKRSGRELLVVNYDPREAAPDWRATLSAAWESVPKSDRDAARLFLQNLTGDRS